MNEKGFTLLELIVVIVILGIVTSITIIGILGSINSGKKKTEDLFVETIKDVMDIYLNSEDVKAISFNNTAACQLNGLDVYMTTINFENVINSEYKPITQKDLVNPADKNKACSDASTIEVRIYRDDDYAYYYSIDRSAFNCLLNDTDKKITTLPSTANGCN